jgi:hypothetical protein
MNPNPKIMITSLKKSKYFSLFLLPFLITCFNQVRAQSMQVILITPPCNGNGVVEVNITGFTLPVELFIYNQSNETSTQATFSTSTTYTISDYSGAQLYFSASNGSQYATGNIYSPPFTYEITTSDAICPDLTGEATVTITGGQAPYAINWINFNTDQVVSTGNPASLNPNVVHKIRITDANGCVAGSPYKLDSIGVSLISDLNGTITSTPANCTNGTASITNISGGLAPYSFLWSNGANSQSIADLNQGGYSLWLTDAQGCFKGFYAYVQQSVNLGTQFTMVPATCLQTDGRATAYATGGTPPYTYHWDNGQTGPEISNITGGSYRFDVTDARGCTGQGYAYVNTSTPIVAQANATSSLCTSPTGTASLTITGGQAPYAVTWNTFPAQSGTTATSLPPGVYSFSIEDANGCLRTGSVWVPPVSELNGYLTTAASSCIQPTGTAVMQASGNAPPFTYLWNTGASSPSLSGLEPGSYSCLVRDANQCEKRFYKQVAVNSPVQIGLSTVNASCIFASDGSIAATAYGGTAPYTWSSGSAQLDNLSPGNYYVSVSDANGCRASRHSHVSYDAGNDNCYCTISGYVYNDLNANCTKDSGEEGIPHVMVGCSGNGYVFTDAGGFYSFKVPSGTYTVTENPQGILNLQPCEQNNRSVSVVAASGCNNAISFGNLVPQVHDMKLLSMGYNKPEPGYPYSHSLVISNDGSYPENQIQTGFEHDGQLLFQNSTPLVYEQIDPSGHPHWYSKQSGFPELAPGESIQMFNNFNTPANIPLGTAILLKDTVSYAPPVSNWMNDNSPWNNVEYYTPEVVGSYDPNFKEVRPAGIGPLGKITVRDSILHYIIHFQNTGTAPARLVVLTDSIDDDLNLLTLKPGWSSHAYKASVDENRVLSFRFDNINLPDSSSSPLGSIGIVEYTIHLKPRLLEDTEIKNNVDIFFDFNPPVRTNTTLNTIEKRAGFETESGKINKLNLFPIPSDGSFTLQFEQPGHAHSATCQIMDINGRLIQTDLLQVKTGKNSFNLVLRNAEAGLYLLKVLAGDAVFAGKLVVIK